MRKRIEIVVITESPVIQTGIEKILSTETELNLLATTTTAQEALSSRHEADVVLLYQMRTELVTL